MHRIVNYRSTLILSVIILLSAAACKSNKKIYSKKKITIRMERFEQDLFSVSIYNLEDSISFLEKKYPDFFRLYCYKMIQIGDPQQKGFSDRLKAFTTDFTIYRVNKRVRVVFPDVDDIQKELSATFGNYSIAFPGRQIPHIVTCISGFNQSIVLADSLVAISLDKYLGSGDEFYKLLDPPVPEYIRYVMSPRRVARDVVYAWLTGEFSYHVSNDNLLTKMIYEGRAIYCTKQLMPWINDSLLWGFKSRQQQFCRENEKNMWTYLIEHKLLFEKNKFIVSQFIEEAPFTKDFSKESPGRAAVWMGYQIVRSYMSRNSKVTLNELMKESDYLNILNLSKYNP
jgi:hypothetical protein